MHNFKDFPELTNAQMSDFYFDSPHKQITADFRALVVKVHDGDTITLRVEWRNFDFPLRFLDINAPELKIDKIKNSKGEESKKWLESRILNKEVDIIIDPTNRVEKWGRLLGRVMWRGMDVGEEEMHLGLAIPFSQTNDGVIPEVDKWF